MPLEQIRPSIQLYRAEKAVDTYGNRRSNVSEYSEEDERADERDDEPIRLSRPENMNLLKLGGVGGVTRSGSWGRNQTHSRETYNKHLTQSPEEEENSTLARFGEQSMETSTMRNTRAQSIGGHEPSRATVLEHFRSCSSDVPSSSSRTSTSSYSAAAFSLRSVSNRNSVSSTSSSGTSSHRSPSAVSEDDESTATNTSNRASQLMSSSNSSPSKRSLGSLPDDTPRTARSLERVGEGERAEEGESTKSVADVTHHPDPEEDDETTLMADHEEAGKQDTSSAANLPRNVVQPSQEVHAEPVKTSSNSAPRSSQQQINALTLSAAAASPVIPPDDASTSTFVPPTPRRHTGAFALRSQSALSQAGGAYGAFTGGGGGRAAAREQARATTSYDNAPFSELEARGALAQKVPAPRPAFVAVGSLPTSPTVLRGFSSSSSFTLAGSNNVGSSSATSPVLSERMLADSGNHHLVSFAKSSAQSLSPNVLNPSWNLRDPTATSPDISPLVMDGDAYRDTFPRPPPSPLDLEAARGSPMSAQLSAPLSRSSGLGITTDGTAKTSRPSLKHSSSGSLSTTNVLRTPTTEEWSRFLAKQGLDPALVAANNAGRARTSTGKSSSSQRRQLSDRLTGLAMAPNAMTTTTTADAAVFTQSKEAGERKASVVSMDASSSEDEDDSLEEEELMKSLRQLGLSRAGPTKASSLLGVDDLSMLREENEEDAGSDGGEPGDDSSSDERMQALHEAISRPPSRRGSPPPLDLPAHLREAGESQGEGYRRVLKRPSRDAAAAVMGYPLPPLGERRKIDDFVVLSDIGRGAYGLVKRVQLKDQATGQGCGPEFCIKYIIKSRILADCWRRHKVLGPIPIEIHVMDQLRRLPYKPPTQLPPWSVERLLSLDVAPSDSVGHPSLCKMLDFFEDHEFYYMVMPCFGKGQDLFDHVESQPHGLSSLQVRCIFGQIADGLRFLHQNNIVHRDVKDENVILDGNGHVQIIDFGSAAHVNRNGRPFDTFSGTLDYAAAEILKGERYGGKEQDVWALGVVGYVLLCGDCPFWNGEEAIQGLRADSRAFHVLQERCQPVPFHSAPEHGLAEEMAKREADLRGQVGGGGKLEDAADLIAACLEVEPARRPTMDAICQHRFLVGDDGGWHGRGGWREAEAVSKLELDGQ